MKISEIITNLSREREAQRFANELHIANSQTLQIPEIRPSKPSILDRMDNFIALGRDTWSSIATEKHIDHDIGTFETGILSDESYVIGYSEVANKHETIIGK